MALNIFYKCRKITINITQEKAKYCFDKKTMLWNLKVSVQKL